MFKFGPFPLAAQHLGAVTYSLEHVPWTHVGTKILLVAAEDGFDKVRGTFMLLSFPQGIPSLGGRHQLPAIFVY